MGMGMGMWMGGMRVCGCGFGDGIVMAFILFLQTLLRSFESLFQLSTQVSIHKCYCKSKPSHRSVSSSIIVHA